MNLVGDYYCYYDPFDRHNRYANQQSYQETVSGRDYVHLFVDSKIVVIEFVSNGVVIHTKAFDNLGHTQLTPSNWWHYLPKRCVTLKSIQEIINKLNIKYIVDESFIYI